MESPRTTLAGRLTIEWVGSYKTLGSSAEVRRAGLIAEVKALEERLDGLRAYVETKERETGLLLMPMIDLDPLSVKHGEYSAYLDLLQVIDRLKLIDKAGELNE